MSEVLHLKEIFVSGQAKIDESNKEQCNIDETLV